MEKKLFDAALFLLFKSLNSPLHGGNKTQKNLIIKKNHPNTKKFLSCIRSSPCKKRGGGGGGG
ncbi:hypothetical protein ACVGWV_02540, partial [Enterobacter asburiae]